MGIFDDIPFGNDAAPQPAPSAGSSRFGDVPMQGPTEAPVTAGQAAERGFFNAVTFNFYDELAGLVRAGGVDPDTPDGLKALKGLFVGAYSKLVGDAEAERLYQEERDKRRAETERFERERPISSLAGGLGGAVAVPIGLAARGATWGARALQAGATGAGIGAVSGFGAGEGLGGSATGAAIGAPVGFGVGAALSPVMDVGTELVRRGADPFVRAFRGRNPERAALREIGIVGRQAQESGDIGLTPAEYAAAQAEGVPVIALDRLGVGGQTFARSRSDISADAQAALQRATTDRYTDTSDRLSQWMRGQFNYPDPDAQRQAIVASQRATNPPAYRAAEVEAARLHPTGLWDESLEQIAQAPVVQDAIRKASVTGANRAARAGFTPIGNPFTLDRQSGRMVLRTDAEGNVVGRPNLSFWDEVKKNLDLGGRDAQDFARVLRQHLDDLVPGYGDARAGAAAFFGQRDASQAGAAFMGRGKVGVTGSGDFPLPEARRAVAQMNDTERQLFQDGYAGALIAKLSGLDGASRTRFLQTLRNTPNAREELEIALGRQRSEQLLARLHVENIMDRSRNAFGGSQTSKNLMNVLLTGGGASAVGGVGGTGGDIYDMATVGFVPALMLGGRHLGKHIDRNVARRVGEMLASPDQTVIERGMAMLASNPTLRAALQAADELTLRAIGRFGAQQLPARIGGNEGQ